jgi:hypothetical protein
MSLGQIPEGGTVEKLLFSARPETRSRSRMLEVFYREQGRMFMYNAAQFYTARRKFAMLGRDGLQLTDYDFDPSSFYPVRSDDPRPRVEIAEEHFKQFSFYIAPASLLRSAQTSDQLLALSLFRDGALDIQSLLERLDWPNAQQVMARLAEQMAMKQQMEQQAEGGAGAGMPDLPPMGGAPQGRPPSAQEMPQMRSDGYMSESG